MEVRRSDSSHHSRFFRFSGLGVASQAPKAKTGGSITSHDIARLAQVSQATVSRVLRDDPKVSPRTREHVLKILAETRYEPSAAARAFRGGRADSIGVVVARLSYQLYPAMLEAIGAQLAPRGLLLIGLDVIGEHITEINVTSPTCFQEIQQQTGCDVAALFIDALEKACR